MSNCDHIYDEHDLCFECNKPRPKTQTDLDRRYRAKQREQGIVRKTVRCPADRWPELQEIAKQMREENKNLQKTRNNGAK